jgi:hypothetical protein
MEYIKEFVETHKEDVGKAALVRHNEKNAGRLLQKGMKGMTLSS